MLKYSFMKKLFTTLFFAAGMIGITHAQIAWSFVRSATPSWPGANVKDMVLDEDKSIVMFGDIGLIDSVQGELYVAKLDSLGNMVWEDEIDKPETEELAYSINHTSDGGYILAANTYPDYFPWLIKLDNDGNIVWSSEAWTDLLTPNATYSVFAYEMASGDIAMVVDDDLTHGLDIYTVSGSDGSMLSSTSYLYSDYLAGLSFLTVASDYATTGDGGFIVTGNTTDFLSQHSFIWKFDGSLNSEFAHDLYLPCDYGITNIKVAESGVYYLSGSAPNGIEYGISGNAGILIKCDVDGDTLWTYAYGGDFDNTEGHDLSILGGGDGSDIFLFDYSFDGPFFAWSDTSKIELQLLSILSGYPGYNERVTMNYSLYQTFDVLLNTNDGGFACGGSFYGEPGAGIPSEMFVMKTGADTTLPECVLDCVWPGDADNNGTADMDDLLAVGVGYGYTGPVRDDASIGWYAHHADAWTDTLPDGSNLKYTDCDGNGSINDDDTLAISTNYSLNHPIYTLKSTAGDVPLYFDTSVPLVLGNNSVPIMLGNMDSSLDAIYGIRFSVSLTADWIDPNSIKVQFNDSWFGSSLNTLQLNKNNPVAGTGDAGLVRTDHTNASGYGQIGTLSFVVIDNIAGKLNSDDYTGIGLYDVHAIRADMSEISIQAEPATITVALGVSQSQSAQFGAYPNPVSGNVLQLVVPAGETLDNIVLYDLAGREVRAYGKADYATGFLDISGIPQGEYMLRALGQSNTYTQKLIILQPK